MKTGSLTGEGVARRLVWGGSAQGWEDLLEGRQTWCWAS